MPVRPLSSSAFSPALPSLLARCWKAQFLTPLITGGNAQILQHSSYSSIAEAMFSRAIQNFEPTPTVRRESVVATVPSNSAVSTLDGFLKASSQNSQKSLGGFTKYINNSINSQGDHPNSLNRNKTLLGDQVIKSRKRTSAEMNGFAAALDKADAFMDPIPVVDLTLENNQPVKPISKSHSAFEFDLNDFDDDSDIDLDIDYPQALPPLNTTREALSTVPLSNSQTALPNISWIAGASNIRQPTSSAVTWSSSPSTHNLPPREATFCRQSEEAQTSNTKQLSSEASADAYPRPPKRRTMPWLQKEAEERRRQEEAKSEKAGESPEHLTRKDSRQKFTAQDKNKSYPWNTTPSAVKEQQKAFKNQQRRAPKEGSTSLADMQDVVHTTHQAKQVVIQLSEEQEKVRDLVVNKKKSVFFTGSAGTGKSVLMRSIIGDLRKVYVRESDRLAVTASTGLAACNIGGVTLHSFAGIGLGKEDISGLVKKINRNQKAKMRWIRTKILVIDEVSMVDGELFDKLEAVARLIRKNGRPFGGIQLIITGDFFQLPPVPEGKNKEVKFAFDAGTWSTVVHHTIGLTEVFRQKDPVFANMLNEMRLGNISDETVKAFRRLERPIKCEDSLEATELFPMRHEVDNANAFKMRDLQGKEYHFKAEDSGTMKEITARDKLLANCMAPPSLTLKKGAQVMLIKNIDDSLVNGSLGRVIAFMSEKTFEIYDEDPDILDAERDDEREMGNTFRQARNKLKSMMNKDLVADTAKEYPLVRFTMPDGTSRDLLCQPEDWKVELPSGEVQAQRRQLPLILAWALSIHKAQGQTLQRVRVDLRKVFEKGQAYVALSRATCQEGLQVTGFDKRKVMAHPRVGDFYNSLYNVNNAMTHPKAVKSSARKSTDHGANFNENTVEGRGLFGFDEYNEEAVAPYA